MRQGTGQEAASRQYRGRGRGNSQGRKEGGGVNFAANSSGGRVKNKENWMYKLVFLTLNRLKVFELFRWDGQYV